MAGLTDLHVDSMFLRLGVAERVHSIEEAPTGPEINGELGFVIQVETDDTAGHLRFPVLLSASQTYAGGAAGVGWSVSRQLSVDLTLGAGELERGGDSGYAVLPAVTMGVGNIRRWGFESTRILNLQANVIASTDVDGVRAGEVQVIASADVAPFVAVAGLFLFFGVVAAVGAAVEGVANVFTD